jgi:hypothetical protein
MDNTSNVLSLLGNKLLAYKLNLFKYQLIILNIII